jgi:ElaB/YqjD/DUF883 family membrane-anchored ribosome-binding protein
MADSASDTIDETLSHQAQEARDASERVYRAARDYAAQGRGYVGEVGGQVVRFVEEEPWLAVACAFVVGYAVAQVIKRLS